MVDQMKKRYGVIIFCSFLLGPFSIVLADDHLSSEQEEKLSSEPLSCQAVVDFGYKLSLVNGHLWAASELVSQNQFELAKRHSKHPSEEIYTELLPYFKAIESRGFSEELSRLSNLFDANNTVNFPAAYSATKQRIDRHFVELPLSDDGKRVIVYKLLSQALTEFEVGVREGSVTDLQEYQDARGFAEMAGDIASDLGPVAKGIERAKTLWVGLVPQTDQKIDEPIILRRILERMKSVLDDESRRSLCVGLG